MTLQPNGTAVLALQRDWAKQRNLPVDLQGYCADYPSNLRAALSPATFTAFDQGNGSELRKQKGRPAKMCALHSSAALVVNVFDFWSGRDLARVLTALDVDGAASDFVFEAQLPTGARGFSPNVDLLVHLVPNGIVGVDSKFTEWMNRTDRTTSLLPYIAKDPSLWSLAGLPAADRLARDLSSGKDGFEFLDVPQLLKHALGLARHASSDATTWQLRYVYFDALCSAQAKHAEELSRFEAAVGAELGFRAVTYQALVAALGPAEDVEEAAYFEYVHARYLGGS